MSHYGHPIFALSSDAVKRQFLLQDYRKVDNVILLNIHSSIS